LYVHLFIYLFIIFNKKCFLICSWCNERIQNKNTNWWLERLGRLISGRWERE